ncbi:hypothetical protein BDW02DRAFT_139520 [Decorospora gaudefroyi]|uniref:Uncharacterized protein n=1 Tax=Decorospora gaudefroyi TaxID=184978 RepID=A0A6A5KJQ1_9PLEO|nr:hypothetical protein BDW02DRAFT_139520 [Decorospora gaudefroyi]
MQSKKVSLSEGYAVLRHEKRAGVAIAVSEYSDTWGWGCDVLEATRASASRPAEEPCMRGDEATRYSPRLQRTT